MSRFKNFINSLGREKSTSKTTNPYTMPGISNKATDDRYMNLAISKRNWQIVVLGLLIANVIQAIMLGFVAVHSKVETRVALVNNGMVLDTLRTDDLSPTERTKLVKVFLQRFIMDSRLVTNDEVLEKKALANAYARVSDQAFVYLNEWYAKNDPFIIAGKYTVSVEIVNALEQSPSTWQITWDETERSVPSGTVIGTSRWYAQLSYKNSEPQPEHVKSNPFGIYINQLTWSQAQ